MPAQSVASLDRLARLSRTMEVVTIVGMAFIAGGMLAAFLIPDWTRNIVLAKLGLFGTTLPLSPAARLAVAIVMGVPVGVLLYGLVAVAPCSASSPRGTCSPSAPRSGCRPSP